MDNNMIALQNLYVALGGSLTDTYEDIANGIPVSDYTIKPEIIEAISKKVPSGSASLPSVTAADNGKVLKVVDGAWAVAEDAVE